MHWNCGIFHYSLEIILALKTIAFKKHIKNLSSAAGASLLFMFLLFYASNITSLFVMLLNYFFYPSFLCRRAGKFKFAQLSKHWSNFSGVSFSGATWNKACEMYCKFCSVSDKKSLYRLLSAFCGKPWKILIFLLPPPPRWTEILIFPWKSYWKIFS